MVGTITGGTTTTTGGGVGTTTGTGTSTTGLGGAISGIGHSPQARAGDVAGGAVIIELLDEGLIRIGAGRLNAVIIRPALPLHLDGRGGELGLLAGHRARMKLMSAAVAGRIAAGPGPLTSNTMPVCLRVASRLLRRSEK